VLADYRKRLDAAFRADVDFVLLVGGIGGDVDGSE